MTSIHAYCYQPCRDHMKFRARMTAPKNKINTFPESWRVFQPRLLEAVVMQNWLGRTLRPCSRYCNTWTYRLLFVEVLLQHCHTERHPSRVWTLENFLYSVYSPLCIPVLRLGYLPFIVKLLMGSWLLGTFLCHWYHQPLALAWLPWVLLLPRTIVVERFLVFGLSLIVHDNLSWTPRPHEQAYFKSSQSIHDSTT